MNSAMISDRLDAERKIGSVWREVLNVPSILWTTMSSIWAAPQFIWFKRSRNCAMH